MGRRGCQGGWEHGPEAPLSCTTGYFPPVSSSVKWNDHPTDYLTELLYTLDESIIEKHWRRAGRVVLRGSWRLQSTLLPIISATR